MKNKTIDISLLNQIVYHELLYTAPACNLSLFDGKMGLSLFFFHYFRFTGNCIYETIAEELINDIYEDLHKSMAIDFQFGLCGIGWGIEYLAQNQFIKGDTDEILEEIDLKIMERDLLRMTDFSLETGLEGIIWYVFQRLVSSCNLEKFDDSYKEDLLKVCNNHKSKVTGLLLTLLENRTLPEYSFIDIWDRILMDKHEALSWKDGLKQLIL